MPCRAEKWSCGAQGGELCAVGRSASVSATARGLPGAAPGGQLLSPSLKLLAKVPKGEQVRLVYDAAQTPLQRLLASGVLSQTRQRELSKCVEQVDPLALREHLDVLRHARLRGTRTTAADGKGEFVLPLLRFSLLACTSGPLPVSEEGPGRLAPMRNLWVAIRL